MPQLVISTNESSGTGGVPTGTGTLFLAGLFDAGPPSGGPAYAKCQSLNDVINKFGPRSSVSAIGYDSLNTFFNESGQVAYVSRVTDVSATTASLTLNDGLASPKPTVVATALTAGTEGNRTYISVTAGTGATFTMTTASGSASVSAVSSFANIGVGTPITGAGIPADTYISSINTGASTAVLDATATATATGVTITPGNVTVTVIAEDTSGNVDADETHGPYYLTSQLFADTSSNWVIFSQSAGSGFTVNLPAALTSTPLSGGADANDLTDTSYVTALANFPASLGPGTVTLPGRTTTTCWNGLLAHAAANNRFAVLDMTDSSSSSSVSSAAAALTSSSGYVAANSSYGMFIQGSLIVPGVVPNTTRTVPGSAGVAALLSQVAQTTNQAQNPSGPKWPFGYVQGFTEYFGPLPASSSVAGSFQQTDVNTMEAAGVNCFANFYGALCMFGMVSPISSTVDGIYDQATAGRERMALVSDSQAAMAPFLFDEINLATLSQLDNVLTAVCLNHYNGGALYGATPQAAFLVNVASPVNTNITAEEKQLNAALSVVITRYADTVNTTITVIPVSVGIPGS